MKDSSKTKAQLIEELAGLRKKLSRARKLSPERMSAEDALRQSKERFRNLVEITSDWVWEVDEEAVYTYVSPRIEELLGYTVEEVLGKRPFDLMPAEEAERVAAVFGPIAERMEPFACLENTNLHKDGRLVVLETSGVPLFDSNGIFRGYRGIDRDITGRKEKEEELRKNQAALSMLTGLLDASNDTVLVSDTREGRLIYANEKACSSLGYERDELLSMRVLDIEELFVDLESWQRHVEEVKNKGNMLVEGLHRRSDGSTFPVEVNVQYISMDGMEYLFAINRDITKRKRVEEELKTSEERFRSVFENSASGMVFVDTDGRFMRVNAALCKIVGYSEKELLGKMFNDITLPDDRDVGLGYLKSILAGEIDSVCFEKRYINKAGDTIWVSIVTTLLRDVNSEPLYIISQINNITERRQAEEALKKAHLKLEERVEERTKKLSDEIEERKRAEERLRASQRMLETIFDNAPIMIWGTDEKGILEYFNKKSIEKMGYSYEEAIGMFNMELHPPDERDEVFEKFKVHVEGKLEDKLELPLMTKSGKKLVGSMAQAIYEDESGRKHYFGFVEDITERKRAEEQIKASLKEKEVLLKEIHHRVKNNLQIISSILNLQSGYIEDKELKEIFKESQNRIRSMALVHEQLYQTRDISNISFSGYLKALVANIFKSYVLSPSKVELKMEIEDIKLDIDTSISLGLIVNELCTNALKYAFVDGRQGELRVGFARADNENYLLVVSDNGVGLPGDFDVDKADSMGFLLVNSLVTQLDGTLEVDQSPGTSFRLTFPG